MSKVLLINTVGEISSNNEITLISDQPGYFTTKPISKGRWYYEFTHVKGDYRVLCGFNLNNDTESSFFITEQPGSFYIFSYVSSPVHSANDKTQIIQNYTTISPMLDNLQDGYTIGLGYDTYTKLLSVYYETEIVYYYINCIDDNQRVTPLFLESTGNYQDTIKVNFDGPFKYSIPNGFLPWGIYLTQSTCITINHDVPDSALFIMFIFND